MSEEMLDPITILELDLIATRLMLTDKRDTVTDDDYRSAIIQAYEDVEGWEFWMVEPLLQKVKDYHGFTDHVKDVVGKIFSNILDGYDTRDPHL